MPQSKRSFRWKDGKSLGALVVLYPSLSFANSEFTFANNLRLNSYNELGDVQRAQGDLPSALSSYQPLFP